VPATRAVSVTRTILADRLIDQIRDGPRLSSPAG
jgi:hypothetical protein